MNVSSSTYYIFKVSSGIFIFLLQYTPAQTILGSVDVWWSKSVSISICSQRFKKAKCISKLKRTSEADYKDKVQSILHCNTDLIFLVIYTRFCQITISKQELFPIAHMGWCRWVELRSLMCSAAGWLPSARKKSGP